MSTTHTMPSARTRRRSRGQTTLLIAGVGVAAVTVGVAGFALRGGNGGSVSATETATVRRGSFDISIPVSGELAALKQIEIRNKVDGRSTITEVVAEGTTVKPGDVVLKLNDDEIRTELRQEQEKMIDAEAALNTAEAELAITQITRIAELAKADTAIMLADLALKAWMEGEDPAKRQELTLALEMAEKDHARLEARFVESAKLLDKKFISLDEYKRDEIALIEARAKLEESRLAVTVYEQYQSTHDRAEKESDLAQARSERERVEKQYDAEVRSAEIEVNSKRLQLETTREEVTEEQEQLSYCTVIAPSAGMVVYASSLQQGMGGRNEGRPPQVGTELTKNEAVMIIPDVSQMVASVKVSEALSGLIRQGQRATIISDANSSVPLNGEVLSVGVLAESGGWRDPNRRDYTVKIRIINGQELGLKPSMRCKAEIYVGRVSNALHVPIQSVFRNGPVTFAYVPARGGYAQKQVTIGRASELYIEIKEGLSEGDVVLLREPEADEIVSRLPVPKSEEKELNEEEIGEAPEMPTNALPPGLGGRDANGNGHAGQMGGGMPANGRPQRGGSMGEGRGGGAGGERGAGEIREGGPPSNADSAKDSAENKAGEGEADRDREAGSDSQRRGPRRPRPSESEDEGKKTDDKSDGPTGSPPVSG